MKIEMGESLGASWMKHVRNCKIVQMNWKPSPQWKNKHKEECERLFESAKRIFGAEEVNVFKDNAGVDQLLRQTECDVMGVSIAEFVLHWNALEVAFHEQGLQYGTKEETAAKVAAKLFRIGLCLYAFLDVKSATICFASPKVSPATLAEVLGAVELVRKFFNEIGFDFNIELILNNEFLEKILKPMIDVGGMVADTNELFLRGLQLMNVVGLGADVAEMELPKQDGKRAKRMDGAQEEQRIGAYVRTTLPMVIPRLNEDEIANLCDKDWCKFTFGVNYPVLVEKVDDKRPEHYWATPTVDIRGVTYHITCEWYPRNRGPFDGWVQTWTPDDTNI